MRKIIILALWVLCSGCTSIRDIPRDQIIMVDGTGQLVDPSSNLGSRHTPSSPKGLKAILDMRQADAKFPYLMLVQRFFFGPLYVAIPTIPCLFELSLIRSPCQC